MFEIGPVENVVVPLLPEQASEQGRGSPEALIGERVGAEQEGLDGGGGRHEEGFGDSAKWGIRALFWVPVDGSVWGSSRTRVHGNGGAFKQAED